MQHQKVEQCLRKEAGVARTGILGLLYVRNIIFELEKESIKNCIRIPNLYFDVIITNLKILIFK